VAVLYPTIGLGFWGISDPAAAAAVACAYNDWLARYCAVAPDRLRGAAMVPFQDPAAAVRELRRAHDELGFPAAFIRPNPCLGRSIVDDAYEPFWNAAEELGVAVGVHEGFQLAVPPLGADRAPFNVLVLHAVSHTFEQMFACAQLIANGVLERHPGLRLVFLEAGGGWAPYWLERLDHQAATPPR
jgi:predicted TIM-barrel fold metal-dependent hydrolase